MTGALRVLLVEDSETDAKLVVQELRGTGRPVEFERVESAEGMRDALQKKTWDVVISDWSMPKFSAAAAVAVLKEVGLDLPLIIVSGTIGEDAAVQAMRTGAHDYVLKDKLGRLVPAVERELRESQDRAARREAEEALRRSEARYRRIVETTNEGIWMLDAEGRTSFMNARMGEMLGCEPKQSAGLSPADFLDDDGRATLRNNLGRRRAGVSAQVEIRLLRRGGGSVWVLLGSSPMLDASGRYEGALAMVMDITERKRAEHALLERARVAAMTGDVGIALTQGQSMSETLEGCARAVVDHLGAVLVRVWTLNADGDVLGLQASVGTSVPAGAAFDRIPLGDGAIGLIASERKPVVTSDGPRSFAGHPLIADGSVVGVLATHAREPLTETTLSGLATVADAIAVRVRSKQIEHAKSSIEDQLRQAQKMEAVGRLAGGVAHDFNNVLSVILSYCELMLQDLQPGDPMHDDVDEVRKAGARAAELTRQLLTFSRQQVMAPKVIDLNDVLLGLDKMLHRLLGEDIDLVTRPGLTLGHVKADPGHIEQVIMNLVVNARDAMPTGGKLTIETMNAVLEDDFARTQLPSKAGPYVVLAVSDTGHGMDAATKAHIFEPFFTTKEKGKGTGLGLSTVFGIVQQSGGNVWVYSEPDVGTTFKIYLPRVDAELDARTTLKAPATLRGTETILLVEDEEQVRKVAANVLTQYGYQVLVAGDPVSARLQCERHPSPIALLLSDVVMPQMSGPELARQLAPLRPDMRVLFMSGYTDDSIVRHGVLESNAAFLQKPFTPVALVRKIREILGAPS
jgi:two-component system cell cycle sensor histidine kinase/response regulator CckA